MPLVDKLLQLVDESENEIVQTLRDLIAFQTVNTGVMPTGDELPLCLYLQKKLAVDGVQGDLYPSAANRSNLVARLPGRRGRPRLLLMGHTDVVPIDDPAQWKYPPFSATVADGRIWGRGACDMKDLLTAELMAFLILKRANVSLEGDLILAAAADEETGGDYGFGWLAKNAPDAIRAEFAINEGVGTSVPLDKGHAYMMPVGEKGRLEVRISLRGRGAHAASPWYGDNVSFKLAEIISRIEHYRPELDVSSQFFAQLASLLERTESITVQNVDALAQELAATNPQLASAVRAQSRMTCVPTMFSGGVKSNSVPASSTLTCDVRTLPHQDEAYVRRQIDGILQGIDGATYELLYTAVPSASPYETDLAAAIRGATDRVAGRSDLHWLPGLTTGFTDSRLVRPLGIVAYGFSSDRPDADPTILGNAHGANESTDIASLVFKTKVLVATVCDLLHATDSD